MLRNVLPIFISLIGVCSILAIGPSFYYKSARQHVVGGEFEARYNEVWSVLHGTDPFKIWAGKITSERFYPYDKPELKEDGKTWIHAYTPWSYTYLMPLVMITTKDTAWTIYSTALFAALATIMIIAFRFGAKESKTTTGGIRCAAITMAMGLTASCAIIIGNYSILITLAILLMVIALNKGHDILAGLCWAIAMTKPQDAALLVIPLIIQRKWIAMFTAAGMCLLSTIPPAILTHTSPFELILEATRLRSTCLGSDTSPLLTPFIPLLRHFSLADTLARPLFLFNALAGISLCGTMCWLSRHQKDWILLIAPAIVCCPVWCYMTYIDRCIFSILLLASFVMHFKVNDPQSKNVATLCMISVPFSSIAVLTFCFNLAQIAFDTIDLNINETTYKYALACIDLPIVLCMVIAFFMWGLRASEKTE